MTMTGLEVVDKTVQETNVWLKQIMVKLGTEDRTRALLALRTTLHALRDRIGPQNAVHLGAQLPMLIRGVYYENWRISETPTRERHKQQFLDHIKAEFPRQIELEPEAVARAVFETLTERVDSGEVRKILKVLPGELRELFPETVNHV